MCVPQRAGRQMNSGKSDKAELSVVKELERIFLITKEFYQELQKKAEETKRFNSRMAEPSITC